MGQKLGKSNLLPAAEPFANLPRKSIAQIWQVFNDIADGFGICRDELEEICADLKDELNISRLAMVEKAGTLFTILDTDKNGLIDALEFSSTIAAMSGMRMKEIIEFILSSYDFDGTKVLSIDEVTLALRSTTTGLCKLCAVPSPRENLVEELVAAIFKQVVGEDRLDMARIRITTLVEHLSSHPDVLTWYSSHGEPPQTALQIHELLHAEVDYEEENTYERRSESHTAAVHYDIRSKTVPMESPTPQWYTAAANLTPGQYVMNKMTQEAPDTTLELSWVYGYQAEKAKNNVRYNDVGEVVYHAGKFAVTYNFELHQQRIFTVHTDEILCLAVHPAGVLIATGEAGNIPRLLVWNSSTHEIVFSEKGFHRNGIVQVTFSKDGQMLAAVGLDPCHSVAVYRWADKILLYTSRVDQGKCLGAVFTNDNTLVLGGDSYIYFWSKFAEGYKKRRGNFASYSPVQTITSLATLGTSDSVVSGTVSGQLFMWTDRNCVKNVRAHQGSVNAVYSCVHGVLSGGKDRRVRLWTHRLEPGATFDMSNFGLLPVIRSVCLSADGTSMLVGTKGSDIFEVSAVDGSDLRGGTITSSHYWGKLRAVSMHPSRHEFATVGDDHHLRIWDMNTRSILKVTTFDAEVRAVTYSPSGDVIVVGLGGDLSLPKNGAYVVINEEDLSVVHEARDSVLPLTLVAFSPEGDTLAVASEDGSIYLYAVLDEYELIGRCIRHTQPVIHLDFSQDGEWIRSNSMAKDIAFFNADDASYQSNIAAMKDVKWASCTCIYSWHVRATHRTHYLNESPTSVHATTTEGTNIVGCGTSYGYIRIHSYPCAIDEAEYYRYPAHVSDVACIRFAFDGQRMISIGLHDRCILQWKAKTNTLDSEILVLKEPESEDFAMEIRVADDLLEDIMPYSSSTTTSILNGIAGDEVTLKATLAAKPDPVLDTWLQSVVEPNVPPVKNTNIPEVSLKLEHVYGYRCQDMRNNIRYTATGSIVYPCASVGIVMNCTTRAQNFFQVHTDAISAFAVSPNGKYVATGQQGHQASVIIWEASTTTVLATMPDVQCSAVIALAFSTKGNLLATVSLDNNHIISVYDWRRQTLISRAYTGHSHILDICFSENDNTLLTCGMNTIRFWNITNRIMSCTKPTLNSNGKLQPFLCAVYFNNKPIIGTSDGNLYIFVNESLHHVVKAHVQSVHAIHASQQKELLVTGGKDGVIRIWNIRFENFREIPVDTLIDSVNSRIRSVAFNKEGTHIVVGTRGAEIFEVMLKNNEVTGGKPIVTGHGCRELWGLAVHPTKEEFVTVGDDAIIRLWDSKTCMNIKNIPGDTAARCVAYSYDGKYIAIGFGCSNKIKTRIEMKKEGAFMILSTSDYKIIHEGKDSNEPIRVIKFSQDNKGLVVGSEDSKINVYNVKDHFSKRCTILCHKAAITSIDFSQNGQFIMSVDSTKRICYSESYSGAFIASAAVLRDEKWSTWSSTVGWPVMGLWVCQPETVTPTSVQRSCGGMLLGCGNSAGRLSVMYNPCTERAGYVSAYGHAGVISQLGWLAGDGGLITTGAKDFAIMQWKCIYDTARESGDEGGVSCEDSEVERDGGHEVDENIVTTIARKKTSDNEPVSAPWRSCIVPPSNITDDNHAMPRIHVESDFIHGVRIGDCRQTLCYNEDGHVVFITAAVGIIYDRNELTQKVYTQHKVPLISLDVDTTGKLAASGELAYNPQLHVWDARTTTQYFTIKNIHRRGISSISFSESGSIIASLGQDALHSVVILRSPSKTWIDGYIHSSVSLSPVKMLWIRVIEDNEFPFVAGGNRVVFFMKLNGKTLEKFKGTFGRRRKLQPILCAVEDPKSTSGRSERKMYTGTVTGHVYIWNGLHVEAILTAHDAPVYVIARTKEGFMTGSKDGLVKLWNNDFIQTFQYNTMLFNPQPYHMSVHSIRANHMSTKIIIGMKGNEVYEVCLTTNSSNLILEGHSHGQLHGLEPNPNKADEYATVGDDGVVRVWSASMKVCIRRVPLEFAGRAISWSMDSSKLAVGLGGDVKISTKDGAFMILNSKTLDIIYEDRKSKIWISDIRFSPEDRFLGVASNDGKIYLHDGSTYALIRTLEIPGKDAAVTRFDYSLDCAQIRVCTVNEELFSFHTNDGNLIGSPLTVRDVDWCSCTCYYAWMSQGMWRPATDEVKVVSVDVAVRGDLVVAGYSNGDIRIANYPCQMFGGEFLEMYGVASQACRVRFTVDGKYVLALDAASRVVIQFKITYR